MACVILLGYLCALVYAMLCVGAGALAGRLGMSKPYTRKLVHISVGVEWAILYIFFGPSVHTLAVCLLCLCFLLLSYLKGWFSSSMGSDGDNAPGTVYYAVAMSGMAIASLLHPPLMLPFGVAVACTSLGDGAAGIVGQAVRRHNPKLLGGKSLFGTLSACLVCFLSVLGFSYGFSMGLSALECFLIGLVTALVELLSVKGLDNIAVPWVSCALTYAFMTTPAVYHYLAPILLTPVIIVFALRKHALTKSGIAAAVAVDLFLSVSLGNAGFLLLLLFFTLGVATDKVRRREKERLLAGREEKGSCRDAVQVLANAGVPTLAGLLYLLTPLDVYLVMFIASMAEALGDTVASGLGVLSHRTFDPFRMRRCERGMSGGMSPLGTVSALLSSTLLCITGILLFDLSWQYLWICIPASFLGTVIDSMLGSLLQVKYRCTVCQKATEKRVHCGTPTAHVSGLRFLNNDAVNAASSFSAALLAFVLYLLI